MEPEFESKKTTISDVAEALGVSTTTVSRAISGKGRIGEETKKRVLSYIEEQGYKPNVIAKGLAQSKTFNIAILLPVDCNVSEFPFFQNCMQGVCSAAAKRDYDVLTVYQEDGKAETIKRIIENHKVDGILLSRTLVKDVNAEYIRSNHVPMVAIGSSTDEKLIQVDHNHTKACCELTEQLLHQGIKRIALIGGNQQHMVTCMRYKGFAEAFRKEDIPILADLVYLDVEEEQKVDEVMAEIIQQKAECVICMDDMICSRVLKYLEMRKVSVPKRIKVASFYSSFLVESHIPEVTTLKFDAEKLGEAACNTLLDLIDHRPVSERTFLPYTILTKESTK